MQISFLKDLVSLRTPTSPFTFLNYLHEQGPAVRLHQSHGLTSSLLSNVAIRAADILRAITDEQPDHPATQQRLPAAIRTDPR